MAITNTVNTANQATFNTDTEKIFLGGNETIQMTYTNSTGLEKTIVAGLVIGRIAATDLALPLESDAVDGSAFPTGVLMNESVTVANGASVTITVCNVGDINEAKLIFENGTDTLATPVSLKTLRDRMASDTEGIKLRTMQQTQRFDN